jgi:hypothetical protein
MNDKTFFKAICFGAIIITLAGVRAFAGPTIQNGDFSA